MPLTPKGEGIMDAMKEHYGPEKGKRVFNASANKKKISGVHKTKKPKMQTRYAKR
mgnify:CR=1 FL=1